MRCGSWPLLLFGLSRRPRSLLPRFRFQQTLECFHENRVQSHRGVTTTLRNTVNRVPRLPVASDEVHHFAVTELPPDVPGEVFVPPPHRLGDLEVRVLHRVALPVLAVDEHHLDAGVIKAGTRLRPRDHIGDSALLDALFRKVGQLSGMDKTQKAPQTDRARRWRRWQSDRNDLDLPDTAGGRNATILLVRLLFGSGRGCGCRTIRRFRGSGTGVPSLSATPTTPLRLARLEFGDLCRCERKTRLFVGVHHFLLDAFESVSHREKDRFLLGGGLHLAGLDRCHALGVDRHRRFPCAGVLVEHRSVRRRQSTSFALVQHIFVRRIGHLRLRLLVHDLSLVKKCATKTSKKLPFQPAKKADNFLKGIISYIEKMSNLSSKPCSKRTDLKAVSSRWE